MAGTHVAEKNKCAGGGRVWKKRLTIDLVFDWTTIASTHMTPLPLYLQQLRLAAWELAFMV